jgi:hypothetical protein
MCWGLRAFSMYVPRLDPAVKNGCLMGKLVYGDGQFDVELDDRLLAHLQIVIGAKLRRREAFYFSWLSHDDKRNSIWVQHAIPLRYHYDDATQHPINREWLESLTISANGASGLTVTEEPPAPAPAGKAGRSAP